MLKFLLVALAAAALACGGDGSATPDGGGPDGGGGAVTLAGRLVAGVQAAVAQAPRGTGRRASALQAGDPLAGYRLYCVTFETPPRAASGTADATGVVALDLPAGVPFGCFVLDPAGEGVASVIFRDGAQRGQTLSLSADADLGTVTVDLDHGVAQADAGQSGALSGSGDLPCPLGSWVVTVPRSDCTGSATATFWFVKDDAGALRASFTLGPVQLSGTDGLCGDVSQADLPVTADGDDLTFDFPHDPEGCPSRRMTVTGTPSADCRTMALRSSHGPCVACQDGQCGCGTGTETCTGSFTATRQ